MINLIKISWPYLIAFGFGFYFSFLIFGSEINQLKVNYLTEKNKLNEDNQKALNESLLINDKLNLELIKDQDELVTQSQELEGSIANAIKNDGDNFNGLGNNSLQLYRKALGYCLQNKAVTTNDKVAN